MENNYKARLHEYLRQDIVYQDYLKNQTKEINDFEMFCIEHCEDIKKLLEENEKLENKKRKNKEEK